MKQLIVIFTLISFIIYIGGCTKSVKYSVADLEDQKQLKKLMTNNVNKVKMKNDNVIIIKKDGKINLVSNTITGISKSKDTVNINLKDVEYFYLKETDAGKVIGTILILGVLIYCFANFEVDLSDSNSN